MDTLCNVATTLGSQYIIFAPVVAKVVRTEWVVVVVGDGAVKKTITLGKIR